MDNSSEDEGDCQFFDAYDSITASTEFGFNYTESCSGIDYEVSCSSRYDIWLIGPRSVQDRRGEFLRRMGLSLHDTIARANSEDVNGAVYTTDADGIVSSSSTKVEFSPRKPSISSCFNDAFSLSRGLSTNANLICRSGNMDSSMEFDTDEQRQCLTLKTIRVLGKDQLMATEDGNTFWSSPQIQQLAPKEIEVSQNMARKMDSIKLRWLNGLRSFSCIQESQGDASIMKPSMSHLIAGGSVQKIRVHRSRKPFKELSALYVGQDIQAHEGSIVTMKFSPNGQYLASAGEDRIVRVWQIIEDRRSNGVDIPGIDPSCIYFTVNHLSELAPFMTEQEKTSRSRSLRKASDSVCVIFPQKVFKILETPLHEFCGHSGEILDLSWAENSYLISSSVDETVRLWKVGLDQCLKVFLHSNYVTCVQFNPLDDNYFISGSIDGKVRIWATKSCQVVDWSDIRDIVTAVSYRPDGQGGIIGCLTGICLFFTVSDNRIQLEAEMCLNFKKKQCRRITGFQFFPQDPSKVMVTTADSIVRILHGVDVVGKFRGPRNAGNQISAYVTPDGKHIISACNDSNVYLWNYNHQEKGSVSKLRTITSFECFNADASVAIPWHGLNSGNSENLCLLQVVDNYLRSEFPFSVAEEIFTVSTSKGSATWPEEKLSSSSRRSVPSVCKSEYKILKSSFQSLSISHAWDLVIVTATWDGRIRSFHNYGLPVRP